MVKCTTFDLMNAVISCTKLSHVKQNSRWFSYSCKTGKLSSTQTLLLFLGLGNNFCVLSCISRLLGIKVLRTKPASLIWVGFVFLPLMIDIMAVKTLLKLVVLFIKENRIVSYGYIKSLGV